ncbi:MAG: AraC family transcriptional regulator [Alphaproteobacteria bacterium]|nr:MAG: AraC family transcriptional regulator [Alphaproteobacteria bacterium]
MPDAAGVTHMTFLLVDDFSAMCLMSAVEGLRSANYLLGRTVYRWHLVSHDGGPVRASNGISMEVEADIGEDLKTDFLFVVSSLQNDPPYRSKLHSRLRHFDRKGIKIGALSCGTIILARAGLMDRAKCTLHWEFQPAFKEEFPEIDMVTDLYVIDKGRYTSSGGISGMELILQIVTEMHGEGLAQRIANNFQLDRIRNSGVSQRAGAVARMDTMPGAVQESVRLMLANIELPLSNAEIARAINTSVRNLERMFKRHLKASPAKYYLSLRLEKARELLIHTNVSTLEIALQCGFSSSSYFARCYQREFGRRPSDARRNRP